ncbi:MAG: hypothetical protein C6Y22_30610 [Hapalosiphonaceae cyanobacterium JJU2]|nr:MAG: hypothetical protein C6Y22_30610 [Hapalosiphonaceae cyanobacterium JJU2]
MPLDPETLKAIQDAIKESLPTVVGEAVKPLSEQFDKIQHDNKKLSESLTSLSNYIPGIFDERLKDIKPSLDFISEVKKEYEAEQSDTDEKSDTDKLREAIILAPHPHNTILRG